MLTVKELIFSEKFSLTSFLSLPFNDLSKQSDSYKNHTVECLRRDMRKIFQVV